MGFFRNAGQFLGNVGLADADAILGTFGANNVISSKNYFGDNGDKWDKTVNGVSNVTGKVLPYAAAAAGATVGIPPQASMMAVQGLQQGIGTLNPQNNNTIPQSVQPPQPYYNTTSTNYAPNAAQIYAHGGYIRGNLMGYKDGGVIKGYNGKTGENFVNSVWGDGGNFTGYNPNLPANQFEASPEPTGTPIDLTGYTNLSDPNSNSTNIDLNPQSVPNFNSTKPHPTGLNPYIAGGTAALGLGQTAISLYQLHKLQKQKMPTIGISPQLQNAYNSAQQMAQRGYTGQEEGAFKNNLATNQNTSYHNAISQSGGNLSQALNAGLQSQNINALNQFAANDAALKRENQRYANTFANQFQGVQNENERNALEYRLMREKALGMAAAQGTTNLANAANAAIASTYKG